TIFEDVGTAGPADKAAPQPGLIDRTHRGSRGAIRLWLMLIFILVGATVLVGGLTRLTDSGLSITEWKPVTGALPPLSDAAWQQEFAKYQASPEFLIQNPEMTLQAFKSIFWWEWSHRQLGRILGLVWAAGFLFFWLTRRIPAGWTGRLLGLGGLGALQGALGWWMVASGLSGRMVDVASYRLALHLGLAFFILALTSWFIFKLGRSEAGLMQARRNRDARLFSLSTELLHLAFIQILLGALVAGIDAGRGYTDWPLMGGLIIPAGLFELVPFWSNFFENPALVQFVHRIVGYLLVILTLFVWWRSRASGHMATRAAFNFVLRMMVLQLILGILTVMQGATWPIAIAHQLGAIVIWVLILRARFLAQYPAAQSVRDR
ncbi:MAG: heme A synthase, partial [Paracoccaceae bacterium]